MPGKKEEKNNKIKPKPAGKEKGTSSRELGHSQKKKGK
jgi:hypothetical protein